ncbi:sugar phosphate isomerase [Streptomyces sp. SID8111]|uniref:EboA domain-containing protein n=1 Tax=Streptomyces sp. SID8111 TaxID=2706100 RepID=UPI0013C02110|nr:EboA domain-containing protein [Streptomyces sp. SID8111]NEC30123.1 sugar phosphate isomerase [Streptomyces sp. SID8111]
MNSPDAVPATPEADPAGATPATAAHPAAETQAGGPAVHPAAAAQTHQRADHRADHEPGHRTGDPAVLPPADLRRRLADRLDPAARAWLDRALEEAAEHPGTHGPISVWELRLAEAGRRCGPDHADAARILILDAARADADALTRVYSQGTAAERRAVLHALAHLVPGPDAVPLVEDALRTNDTRLVAAALGPYGARHLDPHAWRHAVLKCLFTGVPVDRITDLARRARGDGELARMLGDFAEERTAAGRSVPDDLYRVLTLASTDGPAPPTPAPDRPRAPHHPPADTPHPDDDPHVKET